MKKLPSSLFVLSLALLLTACGGSDKSSGDDKSDNTANTIGGGLGHPDNGGSGGSGGGSTPDTGGSGSGGGTTPDTDDNTINSPFQLISEIGYKSAQKNVMTYKLDYQYQSKKLNKRLLYIGSKGNLSSTTTYQIDNNNHILKEENINLNDDGSELNSSETTYKYNGNKLLSGSTTHSYNGLSSFIVNNWQGDIASKTTFKEFDSNNTTPTFVGIEKRTILNKRVTTKNYGPIETTLVYAANNTPAPRAYVFDSTFKGYEVQLKKEVRRSTVENWKFVYDYEILEKNAQGLPSFIKKTETYSNGKGRGDPDDITIDFISYKYN
ncbi:MAG: hypothetical protein V3U87_01510 [Methylococcaceae bacterium]